jgi:hypothetical protein
VGGELEAVDEFAAGFGWIEDEFLERCSHALVAGDGVWLVDPLETTALEERVRAAGTPAAVIQLLDRHRRDCVAIANRFGVPHHVVPERSVGPFEFLPIRMSRRWREVALWWREERVLVCGDALGTARYFRAGNERLAVHPLLRPRPPALGVEPEAVLCGHGSGVFGDAAEALDEALSTARRRIPGQLASAARAWAQRRRSR